MWFHRFLVLIGLVSYCWSCLDQPTPVVQSNTPLVTTVDSTDHWQPVLDSVQALYGASELRAAMDTAYTYLNSSTTDDWQPSAALGMLWHRLGVFHYLVDEYDAAEQCFRSAISIRGEVLGNDASEVGMSYHNLGVIYKEKGNYLAAISALEEAANIRQKVEEKDRLGRTYQELGIVHNLQGDYDNARNFHQVALPLLTEAYGSEHRHTARSYFNLATLHRKLGQYVPAHEALAEARRIYTSLYGEEHAELASCYNNLGNIYDDQEDYTAALKAYHKSLAINQQIAGPLSMDVAGNFNNLGQTYFQLGELDQARAFQEKSLSIRKELLGEYHPRIANTYHNLAEISLSEGLIDEALAYHQWALQNKFTNFRDSTLTSLPDWDVHTVAGSSIELLEILFAKAKTWQSSFITSDDERDLKAALATYESCDQLIERMRREYTSDESVLFLLSQAVPVYEGALEVIFALQEATPELDQAERAFYFMERSKSVLLLSSLKENQARMAADIPDSLLQIENSLRVDLAYRQRQLVELELTSEVSDSVLQEQSQQLLEQQQKYRELIAQLEVNYPDYVREKYNTAVVPMEVFREDLKIRDQAFVEYFVGERQLFILSLSLDSQVFERIADPARITALVQDCLAGINEPHGRAMRDQYSNSARALYQKLWEPIAATLKTRTVVATAGILGYLPFEALLSKPVDNTSLGDFPFLIHNHQLGYAYSATVYQENHRPQARPPRESVLAFAPGFINDSKFAPLPFSEEEALSIQGLMGGDIALAEEATKSYFQAAASSYRVLHLSSHAAADSSGLGSWIAFSGTEDQQLYLPELYAMDLTAELAVLSACETGLGQISGGEGVMSLARGFAYAGCQSVITTLWKVNHSATTYIMRSLYKSLASGATKDEALRQAQLAYLQDPSLDQVSRHPYYWSAFRQIGNAQAIQFDRRFSYFWWLVGGMLVLASGWMAKRRF